MDPSQRGDARRGRMLPLAVMALAAVLAGCATNNGTHVARYNHARPSSYDPPGPASDPWGPYIREASQRFDVPERWIREVMRQESGGRTGATSPVGAMGLMQVMPETYRDMRLDHRLGDDAYDPRNSVLAGTAYLKFLNGKYGYPALFAAYNTGPGNLEANLLGKRNLPQETIAYLANIRIRLGDKTSGGSFGGVGVGGMTATAKLTRPDGQAVEIDAATVRAVRAVLPGEYPPSASAVIDLGKARQAVQEDVGAATALLKRAGAKL